MEDVQEVEPELDNEQTDWVHNFHAPLGMFHELNIGMHCQPLREIDKW
jgi:hypothetical protein